MENADAEMFKVFARLHPVEAYDLRPDEFCEFMHSEGYEMSDEEMESLINEIRNSII